MFEAGPERDTGSQGGHRGIARIAANICPPIEQLVAFAGGGVQMVIYPPPQSGNSQPKALSALLLDVGHKHGFHPAALLPRLIA